MNNDLEQFSEERLMKLSEYDCAGAEEVCSLARIALAAKQAKPVGYIAEVSGNRVGVLRGLPMPEIGSFIYTTPQIAHTEQDGWIKCSERMPEIEEDYYQTFSSAGVDISYFFEGYFADQNITHWMKLPAAPKPESEG